MNSEKEFMHELLENHPEFKQSEGKIQDIVQQMKQVNPDISANHTYKAQLRSRLMSVADYNPTQSNKTFGFFKFFIPVFSFGFAVFGFWYFSDDFQPQQTMDSLQSNKSYSMMQDENIVESQAFLFSQDIQTEEQFDVNDENAQTRVQKEDMAESQDSSAYEKHKKEFSTFSDNLVDYADIEIGGGVNVDIPEVKQKSLVRDVTLNTQEDITESEQEKIITTQVDLGESQDTEVMADDIMSQGFAPLMMMSDIAEEVDEFKDFCDEHKGVISILSDETRVCKVLEKGNCLEKDYQEGQCFNK